MKSPDFALVRSPLFLQHEIAESHPENAQRLKSIYEIFDDPEWNNVPAISPSAVDESLLREVHAETMCDMTLPLAGQSGWLDPDTYYCPSSISVALAACGSTAQLALRIWNGEYRRGFALTRPPGHHATRDQSMGFCLFNNVAVATKAILQESPKARIAIVDFDLHHGNGTQGLFYDNPNVLFISSHRYPFYPGTGSLTEVGADSAVGTSINFPLPKAYGDDYFMTLYDRLIRPMLRSFAPEMILVSAGFDGHRSDPMGGFALSTQGYGKLAEILIAASEDQKGKILFCLEGGYDPNAVRDSVKEVLQKIKELPRGKILTSPAGLKVVPDATLKDFAKYYRQYFPEVGL